MTELPFVDLGFVVPVFSPGDDPIACLNKEMAFLTVVASSRFPTTNNQLITSSNPRNQATIQDGRVTLQQVQGRQGQNYSGNTYKSNATSSKGNTTSGQARVVKANNLPRLTDIMSQNFRADQATGQSSLINAAFQTEILDTYDSDWMISRLLNAVFLMANISNIVLTLSQREKLALKEQIDSLEQNLSKQIKENESLFKTFSIFKNESKEKENKYMEKEIDLEKKIKELDNIVYKVGQSAQTVHVSLDPGIPASQTQTVIPHNAAFQTEDLDTYDSHCDDLSSAQEVLMANISNYGSDVISKNFEQSPVMDFTDNEISSDSNIITYSQYLQETQQETEKANKEQNNESITAELERYKERVKTFEQRLNIDLSSREKMIDSQMDDMIREKLALKEQIDSLEQNLSKQIKEKESLFKTFIVFKNESKEKENKYMENEIDLEKKIKELDNIVYKVGQSAQTVHMLTKPQAFYDNTHKQALGYQNPFYLRKAQRIKPTLYDGAVISKTHVAMPVIDDEETLILEEESRSKMFEKAKDPEVIAKKISHKPIDYEKLNSLIEDFETRFSPQQELSAEQAFWFHTFNPTIEPSYSPPVIVDVPSELPKVSLVNASLKKLKFHLTQFDSVVKKRTTPSALEEGEWGFEHTKAVFNNEIIPFLKSLKDIFNVFDKDLLNEITEVQTVFDQMEASVQQFSVDKKCLEIAKKEILLENDRLLQKVMSQDVLITVMNSMSLNNDLDIMIKHK
ncbi:hypothetical protein Tco_0072863 [Tanacetum coccineum]